MPGAGESRAISSCIAVLCQPLAQTTPSACIAVL